MYASHRDGHYPEPGPFNIRGQEIQPRESNPIEARDSCVRASAALPPAPSM